MLLTQPVLMVDENQLALQLAPESRSDRLREMCWQHTHHEAIVLKRVVGCGEDTLTGHAKDFAALLEVSDPFIQPDELIVGTCLAFPYDENAINLGYYDPHYPPGHETILSLGLTGIRERARGRLDEETDPDKRDFLQAVEISYAGASEYVEKYARCAAELAAAETDPRRRAELEAISGVCHELATSAPSSFHAALQLVQFTRLFGGHGCIGRFDQWMYPFYQEDLAAGRITRQEAQELLECFFIKLNQFADAAKLPVMKVGAYVRNDSLRNIALAGQTPAGEDACNELTYMCLEASAKLMLPEPKLNVRFFEGSPRRLLQACCRVLAKGVNVLSVFNDRVAVPALSELGIPLEDVRDYCNDGCSELIIGGKGTIRFKVHDSLSALRETISQAGIDRYPTFDDVMADFKAQLTAFMPNGPALDSAITYPYMAASVKDCLSNASPTGARYSIRGWILGEVGNTADGLAAIKKFIYEDGALTWAELLSAIEANYEGYEPLRQMLQNRAPKYGNDDDYVDSIVKEIAEYYCDAVHERARNAAGRGGKSAAGFMLFAIDRKNDLPASPDGRRQGDPTANSFSPALGMDRSGPTAILRSASKVDLSRASHGSVLDVALHSAMIEDEDGFEKFVSLIDAFLRVPSAATLQVNVINRDRLLRARENPDAPEFKTLVVRVWGFSAVFVELPPALQDHVLSRTEHQLSL